MAPISSCHSTSARRVRSPWANAANTWDTFTTDLVTSRATNQAVNSPRARPNTRSPNTRTRAREYVASAAPFDDLGVHLFARLQDGLLLLGLSSWVAWWSAPIRLMASPPTNATGDRRPRCVPGVIGLADDVRSSASTSG